MPEEPSTDKKKNVKLKLLRTVGCYKNDPDPLEHPFFPPLGLATVYAQLRNYGYDISQDDLSMRVHHNNFKKNTEDKKKFSYELFFDENRVKQYIQSGEDNGIEQMIEIALEGVDIAGTEVFLLSVPESPSNSSNILFLLALSRFLKKTTDPAIIVGGDFIALGLLRDYYETTGLVDSVVIGDAEEAVIEMVDEVIASSGHTRPGATRVIEARGNRLIVIPDFSGLPFEKYDLSFLNGHPASSHPLINDFISSGVSMFLFRFTKGCPHSCAFCGSSVGPLGVALQPEEVVDGLENLHKKFNPTGYLLMNDTLNISRDYIKRICELIRKKNLRVLWSACARVNGLDEEIIASLREAGCIRLILGMETASPALLKMVGKGISLEELSHVLKLVSDYGIWTGVEVICGLPHETESDINTTVDFLKRNRPYIDTTYPNMFDLRDNSLMLVKPQEYGIENICTANCYKEDKKSTNFLRFSFDEVGGLKWPDKLKQIQRSYEVVQRAVAPQWTLPGFLEEHYLFYLYSRFSDKEMIKRHHSTTSQIFAKRS